MTLLIVLCAACLWQVCLPQDAAELAEGLIEWRQDGHLVRESHGTDGLQPCFLFDYCLLDYV